MGEDAEEPQGNFILTKLLIDNPIVKWVHGFKVRRQVEGERPLLDWMQKITLIPQFITAKKFDNDTAEHTREDTLEAYGNRFYYSNASADWLAITNEKAANTCSFFEKDAGECMEYYGARRGRYICKDYYDDFQECRYKFKQKLRSIAMREKRQARYREYLAGKRDWDTVYIRQEMPGAWKDPGPNPRDQFGTKFNFD